MSPRFVPRMLTPQQNQAKVTGQKQILRCLTLMQEAFWIVLWQLMNRGFATVIQSLNTKARTSLV